MIRTIVIPNTQTVFFEVPANYVGKEIEVLFYAKDELVEQVTVKNSNAARFKGLLTNDVATKYDTYLKQARNEWDRDL
jgi:uncharacterized membrane protein